MKSGCYLRLTVTIASILSLYCGIADAKPCSEGQYLLTKDCHECPKGCYCEYQGTGDWIALDPSGNGKDHIWQDQVAAFCNPDTKKECPWGDKNLNGGQCGDSWQAKVKRCPTAFPASDGRSTSAEQCKQHCKKNGTKGTASDYDTIIYNKKVDCKAGYFMPRGTNECNKKCDANQTCPGAKNLSPSCTTDQGAINYVTDSGVHCPTTYNGMNYKADLKNKTCITCSSEAVDKTGWYYFPTSCKAGYYMPKNSTQCEKCTDAAMNNFYNTRNNNTFKGKYKPENMYCPGVKNLKLNYASEQGISQCEPPKVRTDDFTGCKDKPATPQSNTPEARCIDRTYKTNSGIMCAAGCKIVGTVESTKNCQYCDSYTDSSCLKQDDWYPYQQNTGNNNNGGTKTVTCKAGEYVPSGQETCVTCTNGFYCPETKTYTVPSSSHQGRKSCDGTVSADRTKCELKNTANCNAGYYVKAGEKTCTPCPSGPYYCPYTKTYTVPQASSQGIEPCAAPMVVSADKIRCENNNGGTTNGSTVTCKAGEYVKAVERTCTPCPDGPYYCPYAKTYTVPQASSQGMLTCAAPMVVSADKTRCENNNGSTTTQWCNSGSFVPAGLTTCIPCKEGPYYCPYSKTYTVPSSNSEGLLDCPGVVSADKTRCDNNDININNNDVTVRCGPGYYVPANTLVCEECPDNYYCPYTRDYSESSVDQGYERCLEPKIVSSDRAECLDTVVICSPGYYLPANKAFCEWCTGASYFCPGGEYAISTEEQGRYFCAFDGIVGDDRASCHMVLSQEQMQYGPQGAASAIINQCWTRGNADAYRYCVFGNDFSQYMNDTDDE